MCLIGFGFGLGAGQTRKFFNAVTALNYTTEECLSAGERIGVIRHPFNLREGICELDWLPHSRIVATRRSRKPACRCKN